MIDIYKGELKSSCHNEEENYIYNNYLKKKRVKMFEKMMCWTWRLIKE